MSSTMRLYQNSRFPSTKEKMATLTPAQLILCEKVYSWAEQNYDKGGHWIVETMEPWEVVKQFKSVANAKGFARLKQERYEDVRAEAF